MPVPVQVAPSIASSKGSSSGEVRPFSPSLSSSQAGVRQQLAASTAALRRPPPSRRSVAAEARWMELVQTRAGARAVWVQRCQQRDAACLDILSAQLNVLSLFTSGTAFINQVDRSTLLKLLSDLRSLATPLSPSPLAQPAVILPEEPRVDGLHVEQATPNGTAV